MLLDIRRGMNDQNIGLFNKLSDILLLHIITAYYSVLYDTTMKEKSTY